MQETTTIEPENMTIPVQCTFCAEVYDLASVVPTVRYPDCTCFRTPCCDHEADDREFLSLPAFRRLVAIEDLIVVIDDEDCRQMFDAAQLATDLGMGFEEIRAFTNGGRPRGTIR